MPKRSKKAPSLTSRAVSKRRLEAAAAAVGYDLHYKAPKARPKERRELAFQARKLAPLALERLQQIILNGKDADAIKACTAILDRGYGRAPVAVDVTHGLEGEQLQAVAQAILARRIEPTPLGGGGVGPQKDDLGVIDGSPLQLVSSAPQTHVKQNESTGNDDDKGEEK